MPCSLTGNLSQACPLAQAGVIKFNIIEFENITSLTVGATGVTAGTLAASKTFKTWTVTEPDVIYGMSSRQSNRENLVQDTFNHKVGIKIPGISQTIANELDGQNSRFIIALKHANGKYYMYGRQRGLVIKKDESTSGTKTSDFNGYDVEFEGLEWSKEVEITSAGMTALGLT